LLLAEFIYTIVFAAYAVHSLFLTAFILVDLP
jgi:hypothetical protein